VTAGGFVAALTAASAAALLVPVSARPRSRERSEGGVPEERSPLLRLRPVLAGLALPAGWVVVGGPVGLLVGLVATVLAWRVLGRVESPASKRRRDELERDLPPAVHLLSACLGAGSATSGALDAVAGALPGAVGEELARIRDRLELGTDPLRVWADVAAHPQLGPLGRAMVRAHRSGAAVGVAVDALATELSARSRAQTDALARSVEVRAAAPLGTCFLPAFVLLGVVPMVVGVFRTMTLFG
jgi:Flp pilus assembly protein TadB